MEALHDPVGLAWISHQVAYCGRQLHAISARAASAPHRIRKYASAASACARVTRLRALGAKRPLPFGDELATDVSASDTTRPLEDMVGIGHQCFESLRRLGFHPPTDSALLRV